MNDPYNATPPSTDSMPRPFAPAARRITPVPAMLLLQLPLATPKKQVTFYPTVQYIAAEHKVDNDENDLWYNINDMQAFREQARVESQQLHLGLPKTDSEDTEATTPTMNNKNNKNPKVAKPCTLAVNDATRGLEARFCRERNRRKYLATKCVVRAQSKLTPDRLATLSSRCSKWAVDLAHTEAVRDYQRAYGTTASKECNVDEQPPHAQQQQSRNQVSKRSLNGSSSPHELGDRRVRARIA